MVMRIAEAFFYTSDLERSLALYRDLLGGTVVESGGPWVALMFGDSNTKLGLYHTGGDPVPFAPAGPNGLRQGATVTFEVSDLPAEIGRLAAAGIQFDGGVVSGDWGQAI
ncbi:MAG TPA: VOC family protein, partial [bacterium]|nr:VOC family protein [bacterium]